MPPPHTEGQTSSRSALWTPEHRTATTGMLLLITLTAFEYMGVGTAMPSIVRELHGERLYSWPFTAFLAASTFATVLSGRLCDRRGPVPALIIGPTLFLIGLVVAGVSHSMVALLAGRVLQGLGSGIQIVGVYVMIALVYPEHDRPTVFGALAAAWVVPALVGPTAAGLLTEHVGWRWVFLALVPPMLAGLALLAPVIKQLLRTGAQPHQESTPRRGLPLAAFAAAGGLSLVTWAGQHPSLGALAWGAVGLVLLVPALRRLLPKGTLTARTGLGVVVLSRGLLAGTFFAVEAFVPLTLSSVHGYSPALAGAPLTVGAIGWSAASAWQGRLQGVSREALIQRGFLLVAGGLGSIALVAPSWGLPWLAFPFWAVAGMGMGIAFPNIGVRLLGLSTPADRGFNSAALQVSDMIGSAALIGLGGMLLVTLASAAAPAVAVVPLDLGMAAIAVLGAVLVGRHRDREPASG